MKRRSIIAVGLLLVSVTPDATTPSAWRRTVGYNYAGLVGAVIDPTGFGLNEKLYIALGNKFGNSGEDLTTNLSRFILAVRAGTVVYPGLNTSDTTAIIQRLIDDVFDDVDIDV